jgi:hypothetical protein
MPIVSKDMYNLSIEELVEKDLAFKINHNEVNLLNSNRFKQRKRNPFSYDITK